MDVIRGELGLPAAPCAVGVGSPISQEAYLKQQFCQKGISDDRHNVSSPSASDILEQ
jgi:hypothetical protein